MYLEHTTRHTAPWPVSKCAEYLRQRCAINGQCDGRFRKSIPGRESRSAGSRHQGDCTTCSFRRPPSCTRSGSATLRQLRPRTAGNETPENSIHRHKLKIFGQPQKVPEKGANQIKSLKNNVNLLPERRWEPERILPTWKPSLPSCSLRWRWYPPGCQEWSSCVHRGRQSAQVWSCSHKLHCTRWGSDLGTCESFFCVRIESRIESAVRFDFELNFRIESAVYTTQAVTPSNELQGAPCRRTVYRPICWRLALWTCVLC